MTENPNADPIPGDSPIQPIAGGETDFAAGVQRLAAAGGHEAVPEIVDVVFDAAISLGATDIHFDPVGRGVRVGLRISGVLHHLTTLPDELAEYIANRCKVLADLPTQASDVPLEGRAPLDWTETETEARVSTHPAVWGECVSIRLFRPESTPSSPNWTGRRERATTSAPTSITS